ncbi:MAG: tetratricopeptide repeat protein [Candidatus Obscuribacterales bacterium]
MQATPTEQKDNATKGGSNLLKTLVLVLILCSFAGAAYYFTRPQETPLTRAIKLVKEGKAAFALPMLEELSREQPDNGEVYPWLARGYLASQRYAEGRTALDTALRLNLSSEQIKPVITDYADYYQRRGDFEEAEKLYHSAARIGPPKLFEAERAKMYLDWADQNTNDNKLEEAIHHLQLGESLSGSLDEATMKAIPHKLSDCYRRLAAVAETQNQDDPAAIKLLEKSLSVCDEPLTRRALAAIYARTGNSDKAIENYEAVSNDDPNNLEVRHHLIELLLERKEFDKAQTALIGLTDREKSVENFELLADVNLKLSNYAGAVRALEEASILRPTPELLTKLRTTLVNWSNMLIAEKKLQEATAVKGHAERVAEQLAMMGEPVNADKDNGKDEQKAWNPGSTPVSIVFSRNWLAKDSLTPEGKIKIRNITGMPITDLNLTAVFYDNTTRKKNGMVMLPVASQARPFPPGEDRWLYFSCPHTVRSDHQLAVVILWQGRFLKEFPVTKQR